MCVCLRAGAQHTSSCCLDHCEPFSSREEMISSTSSLEKHLWHVTGSQRMPVTCLSHACHMTVMPSFLLLIDSVHLTSKCEVLRINVLTLDSGIPTTLTICCHVCIHIHHSVILFYWKHRIPHNQHTAHSNNTHRRNGHNTHTHVTYMHIRVVYTVHTPELPCIPTCL